MIPLVLVTEFYIRDWLNPVLIFFAVNGKCTRLVNEDVKRDYCTRLLANFRVCLLLLDENTLPKRRLLSLVMRSQ